MSQRFRRGLIVAALVVLLITLCTMWWALLLRARRPPRLRIVDESPPTLTIDRALGGAGELEVSARASYRPIVTDVRLAWHLKVFQAEPERHGEVAWQRRYDSQAFPVPKGREVKLIFAEWPVMPPGRYQPGRYAVEVGLSDIGGDPPRVIATDLAWVTIR
jgi:hypothetical protein